MTFRMDQLEEIRRLRKLIQSGAKTVVIDGVTVSIDLEEAKRRLTQLEIAEGLRVPNPRVAQVVTGNR